MTALPSDVRIELFQSMLEAPTKGRKYLAQLQVVHAPPKPGAPPVPTAVMSFYSDDKTKALNDAYGWWNAECERQRNAERNREATSQRMRKKG